MREFSLPASALLLVALLVLNVIGGAPGVVWFAFAPALVWAFVLALRVRR